MAVIHECDFPHEAGERPVITSDLLKMPEIPVYCGEKAAKLARLVRVSCGSKQPVFAVAGLSCFSRPGPRGIDGLEILTEIIDP